MQVNAHIFVYDEDNQPESGVNIYVKMTMPPPISGIYSDLVKTYISDVNGEVLIDDVFVGAQYAIWRGLSDRMRHVIDISEVDPDDLADPGYLYDLPPLVGNDEIDPCASAI